ncbi:MAG TPA: 3'-5' exonuclease, partial [Verrucomicrobiae bacterium]|nr:3'-5' exonuclease [Verrucomicrobiae bacterium]
MDPNFVVLSDEQAHQLRHRTLDGLLESYYGGDTADAAAFRRLVSGRARGADQRIREWIWRVHRYAQSLADPQEWFAGQTALYGEPQPGTWQRWFESGVQSWGKLWLPILESQPKENTPAGLCGEALKRLAAKPSRAQRGPTLREGTPPTEMASALHEILEADSDDKWPKRKKTFFREPLKNFFKEAGFLASLEARDGEDPLAQDWEWTRHDMLALLRATQEFAALYTRAKRESGGVDFADLEQFALKLLRHDSSDAAMDIAASWRKKLKYVFVDEYQDINEAQDAILRALSDQGPEGVRTGNRFLVGDVKQSIYRFRLADPAIFQSYKQNWDAPGSTQGQVIFLSENFRSREGLLDFVNGFFETVMREEVGGVSYDKKARLNFGAATDRLALGRAAQPGRHVELHLRIRGATDEAEDGDDEGSGSRGAMELADLEATEKEARMLALRLRELRERKEQVWDEAGGQFRDVEWRDMAVLLRAPAAKAEAYAKEFNRAGVPLHASRGGFYDATEISDLLGLLQLLDNPLQDLPLLAVLRSPLVGLTLDELAAVRLAGPGEYFWIALQTFNASARTVPAGLETIRAAALGKTRPFVKLFSGWRQRTRQGSVADCLDQVLAETGYEDILRALPRGEERRRNMRRLLQLARKFDPYQRQGLLRFLNFVETQRDAEAEEEPAPPATADAVRLLSIHQSKGLEFPIVALADLGKAFNMSDTRADFLLDSERGICPRVTPPGRNVSYPSLPYWLATQRQIRESLGEELRLLYVAMTRAKDRLVLAGSASASQALQDWKTGTAESLVSTERILSCRNYWAWLQLWLTSATRAEDWQGEWKGANSLIEWTLYSDNDTRLLLEDPAGTASLRPAPQELPEHLLQLARWKYPFERAAHEPAKTSVTAQRRLALLENQEEEATKAPWTREPSGGNRPRNRAGAGPLSAAELGTAHHKFLQFVALPRVSSVEDLRQEAIRLQREHILSS